VTRTEVHVAVPGAEYDVIVGEGVLGDIGEELRARTSAGRAALITDETVARHYGVAVDVALARAGFSVTSMTVPAGETSKNWGLLGDIVEALAAAGLGREDVVVALGGGVVGDLAGFAAAVYLRGVEFVQVPTTLLAMVDSSVGGKTGVDLRAGKNLAGAFKQPLFVLADTSVLSSLPEAEWRSGLAEVAKTAVLDGEEFTAWLEAGAEAIAGRDPEAVGEVVRRCVGFKAGVVGRDEKEEGLRECLNYGHTLGHALEKVLGYGAVTHGAAVAEGMRFAARVAADVAGAEVAFVRRQDRLLDTLGLAALEVGAAPSALLDAMRSDKKARGGAIRMVLAAMPGAWHCSAVDDAVILAHLEAWASTKRGERQ
jgi:3-dehydroquinate synthase